MDRSEKRRISRILAENRDWHNVKDCLPPANHPVVIRFVDNGLAFDENETEILVAEDTKIGRCIRDFNNPDDITKCQWVIDPPFPKYDFSMLSCKEKIRDGSVVTHWAEPTQADLNYYYHQFDFRFKYDKLRLEVDQETEEEVYKALANASAALSWYYGVKEPEEEELKANWQAAQIWRELLRDLQKCIDDGVYMHNGQILKLSEFKDPEDEEGGFPVINRSDDEISLIVANAAVTLIRDIKKHISGDLNQVSDLIKNFFDTIGVPMESNIIQQVFNSNLTDVDIANLIAKIKSELEEE